MSLVALLGEMNRLFDALATQVTLVASPMLSFSVPFTFAIFFALTLYGLYFVHMHVPETAGLELEAITAMMATRAAGGGSPAMVDERAEPARARASENFGAARARTSGGVDVGARPRR